jgi:hypothetical protein
VDADGQEPAWETFGSGRRLRCAGGSLRSQSQQRDGNTYEDELGCFHGLLDYDWPMKCDFQQPDHTPLQTL